MIQWKKASKSIGMSNCVEIGVWKKAEASGSSSGCVEVMGGTSSRFIRDSKLGDASPILEVSPADFAAFVGAAKGGFYDL
jgi:uncharacterized protein DUF397